MLPFLSSLLPLELQFWPRDMNMNNMQSDYTILHFHVCVNEMWDYVDQQIEAYPNTANLDSAILILWYLDQNLDQSVPD